MRSLIQYINEEYKTFRVSDLELRFDCMPGQEYIKFHIPETYSEDDFLIYIQDMYFNELPASENNASNYFGNNSKNIFDVLFEYEKYEKGADAGDCVEWDSNIDNSHNPDEEDFTYVDIKGLQYVIRFDTFDMKDDNITDPKLTIVNICNAINENKNFPLTLKLDEKNIKYTDEV